MYIKQLYVTIKTNLHVCYFFKIISRNKEYALFFCEKLGLVVLFVASRYLLTNRELVSSIANQIAAFVIVYE